MSRGFVLGVSRTAKETPLTKDPDGRSWLGWCCRASWYRGRDCGGSHEDTRIWFWCV